VFADWGRRLEVIDPSGRELLISVGAAVFNLRVAMCHLDRVPSTRLCPDELDLIWQAARPAAPARRCANWLR
jgi:hypothetical protein